MNAVHVPVLLKQVIKFLAPEPGKIYLDATAGEGGYLREILSSGAKAIGLDWNRQAIEILKQNFSSAIAAKRLILAVGNFAELEEILHQLRTEKVDGIVMDLGLSAFLLKKSGRGFSFQQDEPLIMSYSEEPDLTVYEIVNYYPGLELEKIFREFGQERLAKKIAQAIVAYRKEKKIQTSKELAEVIEKAVGRRGRIHPATKAFQALRIAANRELENLAKALPQAIEALNPKGRLVVVSYHSLEDRMVKQFFKGLNQKGNFRILTKKPVVPDDQEIRQNPSARSAKLRAIEKI
ncbi:MAG: 16S rRNA (cytosine(1402)-N(4))-methyltransferase RsmH [Patescibacteria group bacterium]